MDNMHILTLRKKNIEKQSKDQLPFDGQAQQKYNWNW